MYFSKQQKRILTLATGRNPVAVRKLYSRRAKNLRSVQASTSRAITRLQVRGIIERFSIRDGARSIPAIRIKRSRRNLK